MIGPVPSKRLLQDVQVRPRPVPRALPPWAGLVVATGLMACGGSPGTGGSLSWGTVSSPGFTGGVRARCEAVEPLLREAAVRHALDVGLLAGVIRVESTFRPEVVSHAGAVGLMQVMPSNGRRLSCGRLTDPRSNIECGSQVLSRFLKHYDGDLIYALSAYNAGYRYPNTAKKASTTPKNLRYVEKVLGARAAYLRGGCGG